MCGEFLAMRAVTPTPAYGIGRFPGWLADLHHATDRERSGVTKG
jgi:hypothetical protein